MIHEYTHQAIRNMLTDMLLDYKKTDVSVDGENNFADLVEQYSMIVDELLNTEISKAIRYIASYEANKK